MFYFIVLVIMTISIRLLWLFWPFNVIIDGVDCIFLNLYDYNLNCGIRIRNRIHYWVLWFCTIIGNSSVVALILHMSIEKLMHFLDLSIAIFPLPISKKLLSSNKCLADASFYNCTQVLVFGVVYCTCWHFTRLVQI